MKSVLECAEVSVAWSAAKESKLTLSVADGRDREAIYRMRHDVYASELGQHEANREECIRDGLDDWNVYLVAKKGCEIVGFISVTPPQRDCYSIDKYLLRAVVPFQVGPKVFEVRLLTVSPDHRNGDVAYLLMYTALRWVEAHGGEVIMALGRRDILEMYQSVGLNAVGVSVRSGAVTYDLLHASITSLRERLARYETFTRRIEKKTEWKLNFPFRKPAACFHGGEFFTAVGERFDQLHRRASVINADVLDAWFPPAPRVLAAIEEHLPWLLRTSPPTACSGLVAAIAAARGVAPENVLIGAGSSDLIFRALRTWLTPHSRVLILDPTYGEYAHVLEKVIGCTVDRFELSPLNDYDVDVVRLSAELQRGYDLVVLVNPNSPTGRHIPRVELEQLLRSVPEHTRVWVDETYVEYAGPGESQEQFAARSENVIVCKSMSKVYALSGARVAYLCAGAHQLEELRAITPPWVVGLPAQVAAVEALQDPEYYAVRYRETHMLRAQLAAELEMLGWRVAPGIANFLLCHLPANGPDAEEITSACKRQQLFLRNAAAMGRKLGNRAIRIAVKDAVTNARMLEIIRETLVTPGAAVPRLLGGFA